MVAPIDADWNKSDATDAVLNKVTYGQGTAFPSTWPVDRIFWRTDQNKIYKNIGTVGDPIFELIEAAGGQPGDQLFPLNKTITDYLTPIDVNEGRKINDNGKNAASAAGLTGSVRVVKFTGLPVGALVTKIGLNVAVAAGNVRIKAYNDNGAGGDPSTLFNESGSVAIGSTGFIDITLISPATVPASGNMYVGFECDNAALSLFHTVGASGVQKSVAHSFGSGPNPFGGVTNSTNEFNIRITVIQTATAAFDDNVATTYTTATKVGPSLVVQVASSVETASLSIHLDRTNTTETEIQIISSSDEAFTNPILIRTILISDFTDDTWRFLSFPGPGKKQEFFQILGSGGGSSKLAVNEIKSNAVTDWSDEHYHTFLDPTSNSANSEDSN